MGHGGSKGGGGGTGLSAGATGGSTSVLLPSSGSEGCTLLDARSIVAEQLGYLPASLGFVEMYE